MKCVSPLYVKISCGNIKISFPFYVLTVTQEAFWKLGKPAQAFCLSFSYLIYATILLLTLLLLLFAPPNFLITDRRKVRPHNLKLLKLITIVPSLLHWSEPCMALRMSSEASIFREPHHFSTKNKDIHRFTDHQFTISFSHNSVLSAANCLRDMECQEEVDIPKAFVNPCGDFGIAPAQLVLMSKDHNIHCFSAAILRREGECKCGQEASPEMAIHHNLSRKIGIMIRRNKINQNDGRSPRRSASPNKFCVTDVAASFESLKLNKSER
ncbi:hypothetical protein HID58_085220 [Brassica napus]|uniref:Uncharacterized protein n=1 Tax=Brassica napus TaxID=3708 RepID=A0ABQ7XLZ4_BRANA|nr:hypothetical protein HID58_085220 [Brassica napus]